MGSASMPAKRAVLRLAPPAPAVAGNDAPRTGLDSPTLCQVIHPLPVGERTPAAGAPDSIWRARVELAANEKRTGMPVSAVYAAPICCITSVSEEAANTVSGGLAAPATAPDKAATSASSGRYLASDVWWRVMRRKSTLPRH
jgi:hypothetical protein